MKGDFSRDSFDPIRHFSRVLMQQGRVQLDADWNEQQSIVLHFLRTLARDLIGPHGGAKKSFEVARLDPSNFSIASGTYYVDGWLCENDVDVTFTKGNGTQPRQPHYEPAGPNSMENGKGYLAYLDVWERHLSDVEDPSLREVALNGAQTASRAQVVWQVKVIELEETDLPPKGGTDEGWQGWFSRNLYDGPRGLLSTKTAHDTESVDKRPCVVASDSRYRGVENQLYRVEIHSGGKAGEGGTFKWSRENGSVAFTVHEIKGNVVKLSQWWRDERLGLKQDDLVEILDDTRALHFDDNTSEPLRRVTSVDQDAMTITLDEPPVLLSAIADRHPIIRRWDHGATSETELNTIALMEGVPIALEDGISITFEKEVEGRHPHYRTGDYWLIPARTALGDTLWPRLKVGEGGTVGGPKPLPPHGIEHHYAPLATIPITGDVTNLRVEIGK